MARLDESTVFRSHGWGMSPLVLSVLVTMSDTNVCVVHESHGKHVAVVTLCVQGSQQEQAKATTLQA